MRLLIAVFCSWIAFSGTCAFAKTESDSPLLCELLLSADPSNFSRGDLDRKEPTVKTGAILAGFHGGHRVEVERIGERWISGHTTVEFDIQGDPRWLVEALGCEYARFLGFEILSDKKMIVPDREELSAAIAKINSLLTARNQDPIGISYYDSGPENVKVAHYIRKFLDDRALPLADSGNHFVHDISFHTGSIFIPKLALEFLAAKSAFVESFADFLVLKFAGGTELEARAARVLAHRLRNMAVQMIDSTTASQSLYWLSQRRGERLPALRDALELFLAMIPSRSLGVPKEQLLEFIGEKLLIQPMYVTPTERADVGRVLGSKRLSQLMDEFVSRSYPNVEVIASNLKFHPAVDTHDSFVRFFPRANLYERLWRLRYGEITSAIRELQSSAQ